MIKLLAIPLLAGISISALPIAANAQSIRYESSRVCRDSDGDRVPCGRRYVRERDYDDRYYGQRYRRGRDGISIGIGPRGVYIDND